MNATRVSDRDSELARRLVTCDSEGMAVAVDVVRVFTNEFGEFGNELGIVLSGPESAGREQAIAAELGFSETVFVDSVAAASARIRIFTPALELPFAGHPSVGAAWWLASRSTRVDVLNEAAGDVAVRTEADITWITGKASWAPEFVWHPLASAAEVDALDPASFASGHHYAWAWETDGVLRARMFAPTMGIEEDEATGAAAVRLTAQLGRDLLIKQGGGSRLFTRYLGDGDAGPGASGGGTSDGDASDASTSEPSVDVGGRTVFARSLTFL